VLRDKHCFPIKRGGCWRAYPEYPVAEEDRLGCSGAAPVHLSGFIRCTV